MGRINDELHLSSIVIPKVRSSLDRSGHVIVTHDTVQEAIAHADEIVKSVKSKVEGVDNT